jgi:glycerophosphoryl diester phosphodiesterase
VTEYIAHRGVHDVFTENTIDAFRRAIDLRFDGVELDVHATADGVCVVHHDETVVTSKVALSIRGTYFETLHEAAPLVPRLHEVLDVLSGHARAYIEVKSRNIEGYVADVISASSAECAVHSFDHEIVLKMRRLMPNLQTGILQTGRLVDSAHALRAAEAQDLWQWHEFVDRRLVEEVTDIGGRVIVWTSNTPGEWQVFGNMGVTGICTDLPINPPSLMSASSHGIERVQLDP